MKHLVRLLVLLCASATALPAQTAPLDPTRGLAFPAPAASHATLPEEYLWTANDITAQRADRSKFSWTRQDLRIGPHAFRAHFKIDAVPAKATLYLAGPRSARVFLNGRLVGSFDANPDAPIGFHVFHADAATLLRRGENLLAVSAVRGRGIVAGAGPVATQQMAYGEVLAAKIVPAAFGVEAPALAYTDAQWRSVSGEPAGWEQPGFDDSAWPAAASLGPVESNIDFFQWNVDAGMYGWPGYRGMSAPLRTYALNAAAVTHVFPQAGAFDSIPAAQAGKPFTVKLASAAGTDADAPTFLLDFGREVAGRLLVESASDADAVLSVAYGESEIEALATGISTLQQGGNYLGTNLLELPANGTARGPKSAFRYVRVRFLRGAPTLAIKAMRLEGIYYPMAQQGSFVSSDPVLNRIWETGAYTAHLCMQDGLWDAPKRDRGRWVGDIDVEGRVILDAFGDTALLEDTLRRLAEATPPKDHVNGIPSYTALWITSLERLYRHSGDKAFVASQHAALLQFLDRMDQDIGPDGLLLTNGKGWNFVDWAPGLYGQTTEARIGTELQYLRGYVAGAALLTALEDSANAQKYDGQAQRIRSALMQLFDPASRTLGRTWQLNALSVDSLGPVAEGANIWPDVLAHVKQDAPTDQAISPYFGMYLLDAMTTLKHPEAALSWIRSYWGGMLAEGATSFWESYDLRWPKGANAPLSLQADGTSGYFVSLAHGWSAGPTAWLSENVLGIVPAQPGYQEIDIAPHLLGLSFVEGAVPTPHGLVRVRAVPGRIDVDVPAGVRRALLTLGPRMREGSRLWLDGKPVSCATAGDPCSVAIDAAGHHTLEER